MEMIGKEDLWEEAQRIDMGVEIKLCRITDKLFQAKKNKRLENSLQLSFL